MKNSQTNEAVRRKADDRTTIDQETTGERKATNVFENASEEGLYLRRYRRCLGLIERDGRFSGMTGEEKDAYAQRLAAPEYLDLTNDWAFKHLFQSHPALLVRLLDDILAEDITAVEFRNTELTDVSPHDKRILFDLLCRTPGGTILVEMQRVSRSDQRDRLLFYGSRLVTSQVRRGDEKYVLSPVKVICIMNCEDDHPNSPPDKILYHYRLQEVETAEPFGGRISFYLLELPRIMRYTDDYDSPVAAWCRIFRNFAIFAKSRSEKDPEFDTLERAMRVSGLDDREIDNYFSDMMTEKEMRPYIEGAEQQGYRRGFEAGTEQGMEKVAKSLLSLGVPVEQIGIATGLSSERIRTLMQ